MHYGNRLTNATIFMYACIQNCTHIIFYFIFFIYCFTAQVLKVCTGPTACSKTKMVCLDKVTLHMSIHKNMHTGIAVIHSYYTFSNSASICANSAGFSPSKNILSWGPTYMCITPRRVTAELRTAGLVAPNAFLTASTWALISILHWNT